MSDDNKPEAAGAKKKIPTVVYKRKACTGNHYAMDLPLHHCNILKMMEPKLPTVRPESMYNHLLKPVVDDITEKPKRYVSKFRPTVLKENKANKMAMRTMGPVKVEVRHVKLLRKPTNIPPKLEKVPQVSRVRKPGVPLQAERTPREARPKKDFLKTRDSLNTVKPEPAFVDIKGHREILKSSGFVPVYSTKKEYGKIPKYLIKRYKENLLKAEEQHSLLKERIDKETRKQMSDAERKSILQGLRKIWNKVNTDYQVLPLVMDTHSMLARKERLEEEMTHLETAIAMFQDQSNPVFLPHDDD
ncbi:enkurin-like [Platichthys flesus]|uniref:enkurin-like n=1 Tax=Platichthys flesus TaxID=8260 RepID=UPI002DBEB008|nr:enkurin-like [Platichthys flesus]